jgi:hypothetical protein
MGEAYLAQDARLGRCVACMTDESVRGEICVQPFPAPIGKWMISSEDGSKMTQELTPKS